MIDHISGNGATGTRTENETLHGLPPGIQLAATAAVKQGVKANSELLQDALGLEDSATISSEAVLRFEREKEGLRFARQVQRQPEPFDTDKVAQMKALIDNGRMGEYLQNLDTDSLVDAILAGPSGAFLRAVR